MLVYDTTASEVNECLSQVKEKMAKDIDLSAHKISCHIMDAHLVENKEGHHIDIPMSSYSLATSAVLDEIQKINWI